jgi:hypothetical protein
MTIGTGLRTTLLPSGVNAKCVRMGYKPWKMRADGTPRSALPSVAVPGYAERYALFEPTVKNRRVGRGTDPRPGAASA